MRVQQDCTYETPGPPTYGAHCWYEDNGTLVDKVGGSRGDTKLTFYSTSTLNTHLLFCEQIFLFQLTLGLFWEEF